MNLSRPFKKGIALPNHKSRSLLSVQIHRIAPHRFLFFALSRGQIPCVEAGTRVFAGTQIAEGILPLHSSASGHVAEIAASGIRIESDEAATPDPAILPRREIPNAPELLSRFVRDAGIESLSAGHTPTHLRAAEALERKVHTLVLNACTSEGFGTFDDILMMNHPLEILKGAECLKTMCSAERIVIAADQDQIEALEVLNSRNYQLKLELETVSLPARYPFGTDRSVTEQLAGRALGRKEAPESMGYWVEHLATAFAVYEAVYLSKPLYERVVTVTGPCVTEPKNVWAPLGISVRHLIRSAKGLLRDPERLVLGGLMTGEAVDSLDAVIKKKHQAVLVLPKEWLHPEDEMPCIRCGLCIEVCPESLRPEALVRALRTGNCSPVDDDEIEACTECGSCDYVCPSRIPIVGVIRKGKKKCPPPALPQALAAPLVSYASSPQA